MTPDPVRNTILQMRGSTTPHSRNLRRGRFSERGRAYLVTFRSETQKPLFSDLHLGQIVVEEIRHSDQSKNTRTFAFVVMPDHVHWLFELSGDKSLSQIVKYVKGRSSHRINRVRNSTSAVWQTSFHDRAIRREESLSTIAHYIMNNPVRAGFVEDYSDYPMLFAVSEL